MKIANLICVNSILVVTTSGFKGRGVVAQIHEILSGRVAGIFDQVKPNPCLHDLFNAVNGLSGIKLERILAVGGGSVLDSFKFLRVMLRGSNVTADEVVGCLKEGRTLPAIEPLPMVWVPKTSGKGSEVTPFATVWDMKNRQKHSMQSPSFVANIAVLDPVTILALPQEITLSSGLDALSQGLEAT